MYAMTLRRVGQPLEATERPDPVPGPGEVLLAVQACAVCRTDLHVVDGELESGADRIGSGRMAVFAGGRPVALRATRPTLAVAIGGEPVGERYIDWNFVSSSRERIEQAKADWREGRLGQVPGETESIPLPER